MPTSLDRRAALDQLLAPDQSPGGRERFAGKRTLTGQLPGRVQAAEPKPATAPPTGHGQQVQARAYAADPFAGILSGPWVGVEGRLEDAGADQLQRAAAPESACDDDDGSAVGRAHQAAARGVAGGGGSLPHVATIQAAFGRHDLSDVRAHTDGAAATASRALGAHAYATGRDIAFASASPDLHTAAHEAAHIVQQRGGVQLEQGLGQAGDVYERHADAVADAVVRGDGAEGMLDALAGGQAPAPGSGPVQRQPAGAAGAAPGCAAPMIGIEPTDDAGAAVRDAEVTIILVKADVLRANAAMLRHDITPAEAAARAITPLVGAAAAIATIVASHRDLHPRGPRAWTHDLARAGTAHSPEDRRRERADDDTRARVAASLDAITADGLEIASALDDDAQRTALAKALDGATRPAAALGWTRPFSMEEAQDRKYAHDACPFGDDHSPRDCHLDHADRASHTTTIIDQLNRIVRLFIAACQKRSAAFQKAIDVDQRLADFIAGLVVDILLLAITGPVAGSVRRAVLPAAETASAVASTTGTAARAAAKAADADLSKFASEFGKSLRRAATKAPAAASARTEVGDPRQRTMDALSTLAAQFDTQIESVKQSLRALDDRQLVTLEQRLRDYDVTLVDKHVETFATHYLQQVAPIGLEHDGADSLFDGGWYRSDKRAVGRAVRVAMPMGGVRMALVDELTERHPRLAKAERTALVTADRLFGDKDDGLVFGTLHRSAQDTWIDTPDVELHFVRWIDDPRMQAMAAADSVTIPAARVADLPLSSLAATADERATP